MADDKRHVNDFFVEAGFLVPVVSTVTIAVVRGEDDVGVFFEAEISEAVEQDADFGIHFFAEAIVEETEASPIVFGVFDGGINTAIDLAQHL